MPKERNKADGYREKVPIKREKIDACIDSSERGGDAQAQFATGWFLMTGTGVPVDEKKGLKWIHKATFQGYQPAIDIFVFYDLPITIFSTIFADNNPHRLKLRNMSL